MGTDRTQREGVLREQGSEISAATGATRKKLIANLSESDPILDGLYRSAKRRVDGLRCFASVGGSR